jgi:hypothetical protein
MSIVKKYLWLFISILGIAYMLYSNYSTCISPITYSIGTFDERFNITKDEFIKSINSAKEIWEKPLGKELFKHNASGNLIINLVYDDRQATTEKRALLEADTKKVKNLAANVKSDYFKLKDNLEVKQAEYELLVDAYQANQQSYNSEVTFWNQKGGAPLDEYNSLVQKKKDLESQFNDLEPKRQELNRLIAELNNFSNNYNILVENVNDNIEEFNQTSGKEFQEGIYDPNSKSISIYEFSSKEKLVRVLAHELGHALVLDHNTNPESIMYPVNQANSLSLSNEDIASLKNRCRLGKLDLLKF